MSDNKETVPIRLDLYERLNVIAEQRGSSVDALAETALKDFFAKHAPELLKGL